MAWCMVHSTLWVNGRCHFKNLFRDRTPREHLSVLCSCHTLICHTCSRLFNSGGSFIVSFEPQNNSSNFPDDIGEDAVLNYMQSAEGTRPRSLTLTHAQSLSPKGDTVLTTHVPLDPLLN